jgi:hypothetical protein
MTQSSEPKISFNIEDGILVCFITGDRSNQKALQIWSEILHQCQQHDLSLVQVTMALRGKYQPFKAIEIYRSIIALLLPAQVSLAVLDLNHLSAPDTQVACNMGYIKGITVSYFDSQTEAKNWLLSQSKANNGRPINITAKQSNENASSQQEPNEYKNFG